MSIKYSLILVCSYLFLSCQESTEKFNDKGPIDRLSNTSLKEEVLSLDFDTAEVLSKLQIKEGSNQLSLVSTDTVKGLVKTLDTLELIYMAYACQCQDWVDVERYNAVQAYNESKNEDDEYLTFNNYKFGYYLEPSSPKLVLEDNIKVPGNRVTYIGRLYEDEGYPEGFESFMPTKPGKVFRYYSYKIEKSYRVWGPQVFMGIEEETGEPEYLSARLTIR